MIRQDIYENQVNKVFLSIGSNLGDRFRNIELAKMMLSDNRIKIMKSSSFYETLSWPNIKNPKFLNVVFPELPVTASIFALVYILFTLAKLTRKSFVLFVLINFKL